LPDEQAVKKLMDKYLTETKQHCEVVGKVMRYFAKKLGQDEHVRYTVGLLHDADRDHISKSADSHMGEAFEKIMKEGKFPDAIVKDIQSHYTAKTGVPVDSLIRKYLISVDELSGFITAVSLMRPNGLADMEAKSVTKRIKDKAFARAVNRDDLLNCEKYLNIPVADFVTEMIEAMK
jgi:predicted hydrolase (HD superfamily)